MQRIVVVGNGIAGLTACDSLRAAGFDGELTVVGAEHHAPYSRPALSKAALLEGGTMTAHQLPAPEHAATEILGVSAVRLDAARKLVQLNDGTQVPYDGLVIATGSRPRRLSPGQPAELTLRTLEDAAELRRRLATRPTVIVVGGGALGMEIASGCLASGCEVTLVAPEAPMVHQLGPHLSEVFTSAARRAGLTIVTAQAVGAWEDGGHSQVALADGFVLDAELVISAVGDVPNVEWLTGSGLLTDGRLEVDTRGRLRPDIVAAGDVAVLPTSRGVRRIPLWTSAIEQSRVAAAALLRGDDAPELELVPYFWTEQFGLTLKVSGHLPLAGAPEILAGDPLENSALLRWAHEDGTGTAVALNHRIPVPRLRRLSSAAPAAAPTAA